MARTFKDVNGETHNLDALIETGHLNLDSDIDILTREITRYFVKHEYANGMSMEQSIIDITKDYYDALLKEIEGLGEHQRKDSLTQSILNYKEIDNNVK